MDSLLFADWLAPCELDAPCGIALDGDPDFFAFETALQGKPEQQYGSTIIPAEKPDWRAVRQTATTLLKRSKDLRVAGALTRSLTVLEGLPGLAKGLGLISTLLGQLWDEVHPSLQQDGERDPFIRANALAMLSDTPTLIAEIRDAVFVSGAGMSLSVREAESIVAPTDAAQPPATREQLQNMLLDQLNRDATNLHAVEYASMQLDAIVFVCNEKLDRQEAPDLTEVSKLLKLLAQTIASARGSIVESDESTDEEGLHGEVASTASFKVGKLASRADAVRALDAVCAYFEKHEPSSPVPVLLNRAKKLTGMSFLDIIRDMSPESMSAINLIAGASNDS
jgi:type VI secretion system protein ImpA